MHASDSDDGVSTSLLGKRSASPAGQRSTKSVVSQVRDTLFGFIKRAKRETNKTDDKKLSENRIEEVPHSISQKQRSFESFTERISTFTVSNWMGKPLSLSPPLFAQYGWQCIGVDTVKCCSCSALFCVRLPWPDADNFRQHCYNYRKKVITAHMKICSWPSYPCSDSVIAPFLFGGSAPSDILSEFVNRRDNLILLGKKLPKLDPEVMDFLSLNAKDLNLLQNVKVDNEVVREDDYEVISCEAHTDEFSQNATAAILAMCGWDTSHTLNTSSPSILCKSSGRIVSLRNFFIIADNESVADAESSESDANGVETHSEKDVADKVKLKLIDSSQNGENSPSHLRIEKQKFHPLQQQCPWSYWIAVLKPITKDEFKDLADENSISVTTGDKNCNIFEHIDNPLIMDAKPGWLVVRDTILKRKNMSEKSEINHKKDAGINLNTQQNAQQTQEHSAQNTPTKSPVLHVRKLLREWSSPK